MQKIPATLLSLALAATLTVPGAKAAQAPSALPELDGHWSQAAFERWHAYGIVEGDARGMRPDDAMMVSEFAALLSRAMGYQDTVENPYADLKGDEWYAPYILQLTAAGILEGDGVNCNADERMSRERATVLFARALGILPTEEADLSGFVDGDSAADWSAGYIDAMAKAGIIQGVGGGRLALAADITRGSVVTILNNAVAGYITQAGTTVDADVDGILLVAADDVKVEGAKVSGNLIVSPKADGGSLELTGAAVEGELWVAAHDATLSVADSQVEGVALSGHRASLTLGEGARVNRLAVDGADGAVALESGASVETLTARSAVKVDNQGAISKARIEADHVIIDGNRPSFVEVAEGVAPPADSEGSQVTGSEDDNQEDGQEEETLSGILGVTPVDQDGLVEEMPAVTAQATRAPEEDFVRIALSTDGVVPIHQSEGAGKGAWVGVAVEAPAGYESGSFHYAFGTEASASADQSAPVTQDPAIGEGKYAVFFINASALTPKTHITLQWEGQEAVQYVVDLSGVQTPAVELSGVTVSTHELPSGVESTGTGLSFDASTALVQNGGSGELSQEQVSGMGGGGEYTVYYSVPQALDEGVLQFDKIARSVNGGKWNSWAISSDTGAEEGSGWWTKDGGHYYFKWGAVFAQQADGLYQMKDGGVFDYTLAFLDSDGSQDNVVATCTFRIDLSGYTISAGEE